ncbi:YiiX/YebB-like N1pC/P60 family cysteine hydrolase [Pseudomonas sp. PGPPP2]|uniref:YiiX/YebB-like N1pC/P60 family cysteine hydrolase n=1 Tax=Pseudomonas sp. PGPPP2 TaxID=2015554 RepID=UPI000BD28EF1|nr:YiiX/YebB-like N1pC/P60 family cysteine hydrolase [Pseudomonas sp. PGPPP2]OYT76824.1 MAG: hypothetical protein CFE48_23630 [Pseudomonas sp. PGPPP2]
MKGLEELAEEVRNMARADVLKLMADEGKTAKAFEDLAAAPDESIDFVARMSGVPEHQFPVYRAMVRREENEYSSKIAELSVILQTGDVILVTGKKFKSKALVAAQTPFYSKARASHVAMVHANVVCIDANMGIGVKHHTIAEVLSNVEDNWRIIRFNTVTDEHRERMLLRSAYYLQQPYSIRPINGAGAKFSYCSELVNKIYRDSGVRSIKVSKGVMVNPCHFDRLADKGEVCQDITESVRPFAPFFREYKEMIAMQAHAMVAGLKLNRYRDKQRKELLAEAQAQAKAGNLPHETLVKLAQGIQNLESKMNFRFWDSIPR